MWEKWNRNRNRNGPHHERCTGATGSYYFEKLSPFISVHDLSILILHGISLSSTYTLLFSFLSSDSALEIIAAGRLQSIGIVACSRVARQYCLSNRADSFFSLFLNNFLSFHFPNDATIFNTYMWSIQCLVGGPLGENDLYN